MLFRSWILKSTVSSASVKHAIIEDARNGIIDETASAALKVDGLEARNNSRAGMRVVDGTPTVQNSKFHDNRYGIRIRPGAGGTFKKVQIYGNQDHGVYVQCSSTGSKTATFDHATIWNNRSDGVYFYCSRSSSRMTVEVLNSIVANNQSDGIYTTYNRSGYGTVTVRHSDVWGNGDNFDDVTPGTGTFSSNPLFVSSNNPRLTENSPARFADKNGNDIGALPYTGDPTPKLQGVLWQDTTLKAANSPHSVEGDLTVPKSVKLTLEPGVVVQAYSNDSMQAGEDTNSTELQIEGEIVAKGQPNNRIEFKSRSGNWYGIHMKSGSTGTFRRVDITNGRNGIRSETTKSLTIDKAEFYANSRAGLRVEKGSPTVDASLFRDNRYGIRVRPSAGLKLTNGVIRSNTDHGIYAQCDSTNTKKISIHSSTIYNNRSDGVYFYCSRSSSNKQVELINSIVAKNQSDGVYTTYNRSGYGTFTVEYSNVWGNGDDFDDVSKGTGTISSNPLFKNAPNDFSLQSTSFCVDAGTMTGAPNHDYNGKKRPVDGDNANGAEYDMGAFEYGAMVVCGDGAVGPGESCDDGKNKNGKYGYCDSNCKGLGPHCGDGTKNGPEQCDDGNTNSGDGCSDMCKREMMGGDTGMMGGDAGMGSDGGGMGGDAGMSDGGGSGSDGGGSGTGDAGGSQADGGGSGGGDATGQLDVNLFPDVKQDTGLPGNKNQQRVDDDDSAGSSGGCGCRATNSGPFGALVPVALLLVGGALLRRRRT